MEEILTADGADVADGGARGRHPLFSGSFFELFCLVDMAINYGHVDSVRVKTAELKNHLSGYLRRVRENHETIVVCDRDVPVAVLAPLEEAGKDSRWHNQCCEMAAEFEKAGLVSRFPAARVDGMPEVIPALAMDGRTDVSTVEKIRRSRDW